MKRRSFLKAAAAAFPAVGLNAFALGPDSSRPAADGIHPVEAGQDRFGETHSLGFSTILFKAVPRETNNGCSSSNTCTLGMVVLRCTFISTRKNGST